MSTPAPTRVHPTGKPEYVRLSQKAKAALELACEEANIVSAVTGKRSHFAGIAGISLGLLTVTTPEIARLGRAALKAAQAQANTEACHRGAKND